MARVWTVSHRIRWTPIITFGVRRLRLLEWFEKYTEPVAFMEGEGSFGISLLDPSLRLTVWRDRAVLASANPDLELAAMEPALRGVFEVLEPSRCVVAATDSLWSHELVGQEYNAARSVLARSHLQMRGDWDGFRAVDTSALVDVASAERAAQIEYGVVNSEELVERVQDPEYGRLHSHRPGFGGLLPETMPEVALLADVALRRKIGGQVDDAESLLTEAARSQDIARKIVKRLSEAFEGGGAASEHAQTG